jgi:acetyl-CoA acetyltransferase
MSGALKDKFAIVGVGLLAGRFEDRSFRTLQTEAARLAIEDAGLTVNDVDGAIDLKIAPGAGDVPSPTDAFPRVLGLPCRMFFQVARGGTASIVGVLAATKFLELGMANYVVLASGTKDYSRSRLARRTGNTSIGVIEKAGYWGKPFGDLAAMSHHTFFAARHMHEFGTKKEQFGEISVAIRGWAQYNPLAQFHDRPLTLSEYMDAPPLVWPYNIFDSCVVSDGGFAIVLTTAERAKDLARKPIHVSGAGVGEAMGQLWWDKANYTCLAVQTAKETAFREAEIDLKDLDFAGLYDCFTAEVLFQLEDYGWCKKGEGGAFVEGGRIGPGGEVAINTSGGLLSAYHLGEQTHVAEAIMQLRGEAGERQVENARIGMVTGHGGEILSPGMCSTHACMILSN